jgi:hypothetical protein
MPTSISTPLAPSDRDWARQPLTIIIWWGLPLAIGMLANVPHLSHRIDAGVWAVVFAWMGTGCVLNARRCHRIHCFISGPVLLLGAVFAALVASGAVESGARTLNNVVNGALLLALLSFVPELVWKRYV